MLSKDTHAKFHLSATFVLSFMISSVTPIWSSTFYAYLINKIRDLDLKIILTESAKILFTFLVPKSLDVPCHCMVFSRFLKMSLLLMVLDKYRIFETSWIWSNLSIFTNFQSTHLMLAFIIATFLGEHQNPACNAASLQKESIYCC